MAINLCYGFRSAAWYSFCASTVSLLLLSGNCLAQASRQADGDSGNTHGGKVNLTTPVDAAREFVDAIVKDDVDRARKCAITDGPHGELMKALIEYAIQSRKVEVKVASKFGHEAASKMLSVPSQMRDLIGRSTVRETADAASLCLGKAEWMSLTLDNGQWKVSGIPTQRSAPSSQANMSETETVQRWIRAYKTVAKEIDEGKVKDVEEAKTELAKLMES